MPRPDPNKRDLFPGARITIETASPKYESRGPFGSQQYALVSPGSYLTFEEFTSVSTIQSLSGAPTATVTLASHRDYWHSKARERPKRTRRQEEISEYLGQVLSISNMTERDPRRRALTQESVKFLGVPIKNFGRKLESILNNLYVRQADNGSEVAAAPPRSRLEEYQAFEWFMADLEEMRRIWIDYKDRNGQWVAGFTGIISDLQDSVVAGQPPMVTVQCSGMLRFWEMSEYITKQAMRNLEWPFPGGSKEFPQSTLSNSLAGYDAVGVLIEMARSVNEWFTYTGEPANSDGPYRSPENYFHHAPVINFSHTPDENSTFGEGGDYLNPYRTLAPGQIGSETTGRLIIDPEITRTDKRRAEVYRRAIRTAFDLYRFESTTPYRVAADVAALTLFDFYEDPRGNVLLWVPKYDALPRLLGERGVRTEDIKVLGSEAGEDFISPFPPGLLGPKESDILSRVRNIPLNPVTTIYGEDYSTLPFHDDTYIIDNTGFISSTLSRSEKSIKTFCRATSQPHLVTLGDTLSAISNSGYTSYEEMAKISPDLANTIVRLNRRYGIRRHTTPTLTTKSVGGETGLLARYAYSVLTRVNAYAFAGAVSLNLRPELWVGRSVFLTERQKLGYITRTQNILNWRQSHQTVLTLAYVHDPAQRIGQPWFERTETQVMADPSDIEGILG